MREKAIKNYYLIINKIAIDVIKRGGVSYIKVADTATGKRKAVFTMELDLISSDFEMDELEDIKLVVLRNMKLLQHRKNELR